MEKKDDSTKDDLESSVIFPKARKSFYDKYKKRVTDSPFDTEALLSLLDRALSTRSVGKNDKKCETLTVFYVDEFSAKLEEDVRPCYVTGCLPIENKQVLVVDKNNMKIKLFDSEFRNTASVKTPHTPWGVTALTRNTFASCGCGNKVITWKISGSRIEKETEIEVTGPAYGISNNTTFLCTMHPEQNALTLISKLNGKIIWTRNFPTAFGKPVNFGFDLHIDETRAYVGCGLGDKRILCISLIGASLLWECPIPGNTCGITEIYNQVLVVDMTEKKIHAVSKDGKYQDLLVLMDYKEKKPQYLGSNSSGRTLFVSEYGGDTVSLFSPRIK